jgi:hypothetical protein
MVFRDWKSAMAIFPEGVKEEVKMGSPHQQVFFVGTADFIESIRE